MLDYLIKGGTIVDGGGGTPEAGDVGVRDGVIVATGVVKESARETVDADGAIVTPGFIDLHTHYDGQVTWDAALEPSASNGVSTVVLGNCGVGFAPVRPADHAELIDMMEGVEDIPGTALADGIPWGQWETFPQYLDVIGRRSYATNVICHLSHGPLRYYVMGERAYEDHDATAEDVEKMAAIVGEAMAAGAAGFSTNRFQIHKSRTGRIVPGTFAPHEELKALAAEVGTAGHGLIQAISEGTLYPNPEVDEMPELDLFGSLSIDTGRPLTFTTAQSNPGTDIFRRVLDGAAEWNARGAQLRPQIIPRAVTIMTTLACYHGFIFRPSYKKIADLPVAERAAEMRRPEVRERILAETDEPTDTGEFLLATLVMNNLHLVFPLSAPIDYEPDPSKSIAAQAKALGKDPVTHYYDLITAGDGGAFFAALTSNFHDGTLEPSREMLLDRYTVSGLSDAGAHVMMISDCSSSTFHLTHWVRDRTKGPRIPLETAVYKLTGAPAQMYGFHDRGLVREGMRADINVIDFDRLTIQEPIIRADLPTGAKRILQPSTGYLARLVNGKMVRRNDNDTGERPGRLLRSSKVVAA
jgi:N-acyl-D-amino-acid deacylase